MVDQFVTTGKKIIKLTSLKKTFKKHEHDSSSSSSNDNNILFQNLTKFELSSTKIGNDEESPSDALKCLWPFLWFSRFLGVCPVVRQGNNIIIKFNPFWIFTIIGFSIQGLMLSHAFKILYNNIKKNDEWVENINEVIYYVHTFGNTLYILWKIRHVPKFFADCKKIELICKKYNTAVIDDGLVKKCTITFAFFSTTQFFGNILYYYAIGDRYNVTSPAEFFQAFNSDFVGEWGSFYTGLFFCLGEFYCDMGWTFGDILLALLSIILGRYFVRLNKEITLRGNSSLAEIEEVRADHRSITNLVQNCNQLFSPLFLLTYVSNVGYLFSRLYTGLEEDLKNPVLSVQIEALYAFLFQIIAKIFLPSYLAAQVHENAHESLNLIHNWTSSLDNSDLNYRLLVMQRFISQLITDPIGISGCGFFMITKGFVVTLISALITYEVIILQFQAAGATK